MAYKINEDLYIGNTNKQLKDLPVSVHDAYSTSATDTYSCNYLNNAINTINKATISLASGCTIETGYDEYVYKSNDGIVILSTRFRKSVSDAGYTQIGQLPVGYRPKQLTLFPFLNEAGVVSFAYIDTNGNIYCMSIGSGYVNYAITISYVSAKK